VTLRYGRSMRGHLVASVLLIVGACSDSGGPADSTIDRSRDVRAPVRDTSIVDARIVDRRADARGDVSTCKLLKPYSTKNTVCNTCAEARCCVEINGCLGDLECDDSYVNCTLACAFAPASDAGVSACLQQCAKDYPKGKTEYDVAIGCAESKCATECK
jgi:hypothetical protein